MIVVGGPDRHSRGGKLGGIEPLLGLNGANFVFDDIG
jgi:hypothetical protein